MDLLFSPARMAPTSSKDYDITLLFILIRNMCGLTAPVSIHGRRSWDGKPHPTDISPEANLVRIKY